MRAARKVAPPTIDERVDAMMATKLSPGGETTPPVAELRQRLERLRVQANVAIDAALLSLVDPFSLDSMRGVEKFALVFYPPDEADAAPLPHTLSGLMETIHEHVARESWGGREPPECPGEPDATIGCGCPVARGERWCSLHRAQQLAGAEVLS